MKTIIEVGANDGTHTLGFLTQENTEVISFEPTPELILHLRTRFKNFNNFTLYPAAVSSINGWAEFNIAGTADWGCSSLHKFNKNVHNEWPNRPDFHFTDKCLVPTIRLDYIVEKHNINAIDYLHIDAQGHDFEVLKSLDKYISIVKKGVCEAAHKVNLYENVNNSSNEIMGWLKEHDFTCSIRPNDKVFAEAQIHFTKNI
jgi:FkbM family methyltransferase